MTIATIQLLVLQLLVPLALVGWLAFARPRSQAAWVMGALLAICYLAAVALAGLWLALPPHLPLLYFALWAIALVRPGGRSSVRSTWPIGPKAWAVAIAAAALTTLVIWTAARALVARRPPDGPLVDLTLPLRDGTCLVVNGGNDLLVNAHLATLTGEQSRPYRGQSYAVDLVALGEWGVRAAGVAPRDPAAYFIFGRAVFAPCSGSVVQAVDGLPDLPPPRADRVHMAGNHVIIRCGEVWVLLGHLQDGSVTVAPGDSVAAGEVVGRVGNTGNTSEPHLHVHAQRPGTVEEPFAGGPLPIRLDGRYLVRNDRIHAARR